MIATRRTALTACGLLMAGGVLAGTTGCFGEKRPKMDDGAAIQLSHPFEPHVIWKCTATDAAMRPSGITALARGDRLGFVAASGLDSDYEYFDGALVCRVATADQDVIVALSDGSVRLIGDASWIASVVDEHDAGEVPEGAKGWWALPPLADEDRVYAMFTSSWYDPPTCIAALTRKDGQISWKRTVAQSEADVSGATGWWELTPEGDILHASASGAIRLIDPETGDELDALEAGAGIGAGAAHRLDGSYTLQTSNGTLLLFGIDDHAFSDVSSHAMPGSYAESFSTHHIRPIDLGTALLCCVPPESHDQTCTLGLVDPTTYDILDRLEGSSPWRQPVLFSHDGALTLLYAAGVRLARVAIEDNAFAAPEQLDIAIENDVTPVPEALWNEKMTQLLLFTDVDELAALSETVAEE